MSPEVSSNAAARARQLALACACPTLLRAQEALVRELVAGEIDGDVLLRFAQRHALSPLVHNHVQRIASGTTFPWLPPLAERFQRTLMWNLQLNAELRRVLEIFQARSIPVLVYKGPALAQLLYGNLGLRVSEDLDLLIRREDVARASATLADEGYLPEYELSGAALAQYNRHSCERNFVEPRTGTLVELHWQILPPLLGIHFDEDLLWSSPQPFEMPGLRCSLLHPDVLLLALAAHAAKHRWSRIAWLADIHELLLRLGAHADSLGSVAERLGMRRVFAVTLLLVRSTLGLDLQFDERSTAGDRRMAERVREENLADSSPAPSTWDWLRFHLEMQDGLPRRARFLLRKAGSSGHRLPAINPAIAAAGPGDS